MEFPEIFIVIGEAVKLGPLSLSVWHIHLRRFCDISITAGIKSKSFDFVPGKDPEDTSMIV
jgi:hypothetical protein